MKRISSLIVASTLAILPIAAFAQPTTAPVKTTAPTTATTSVQPNASADSKGIAPASGKAATAMDSKSNTADGKATTPATKPDAKATEKSQVHGMNTVGAHHAKPVVPAKS
jgi:hypothetical protein